MKKVVLAYSGGLDTSVAVKWLTEKGYGVIAFLADVGQEKELESAMKRAYKAGAVKALMADLKKEFAEEYAFKALKAGAVYESKYMLATALSRPLIAKKLVEVAKKEKAEAVAHGCTGKGNDQVRFEVAIMALAPHLEIIAPVREWELKTREEEIEYAREHNVPIETTKKSPYSLDLNLWGLSIEAGPLEEPWNEVPADAYRLTADPAEAPSEPASLDIYFEKGIPKKINGKAMEPVKLITELNRIGGMHGVGRTDLVENRLVGIKSREIYEAPAAALLYTAHEALENLVIDRELFHFKKILALKYAELVYYGLWFTPLKTALDKFMEETQKRVSGTVRLKLYKGAAYVMRRKSPYSLYKKELATYGKGDVFDQSLAKGFIKLWGMPYSKSR